MAFCMLLHGFSHPCLVTIGMVPRLLKEASVSTINSLEKLGYTKCFFQCIKCILMLHHPFKNSWLLFSNSTSILLGPGFFLVLVRGWTHELVKSLCLLSKLINKLSVVQG